MKVLLFVASALLSAISAHKVVHLNAQNFDTVVDGSRNVLVKFEASWCGPCKRIAPILDIVVREAFSNLNGDTVIAAIDADEEREIGDRFEIDAFPTIKLFLKGRPQEEAIDFTGERTPQGFVGFIKKNIAANLATLPEDVRLAPPNVPMTNILAEMARVGPKPLAPANLNFATAFFEEKTFLPEKPQPKQKNLKHRKDRNRNNKQQVAQKPHKPQNVVGPEYLPIVSADQAQQIISNAGSRPVILIFFSPNCPHCKEFMPLAKKYAETRTDSIFLRINGDENIQYRDQFNLRYYPSIIGFFANSNGKRYELMTNDRGFEIFNSFVNKLIKH